MPTIVAICTWNRSALLRQTLDSMTAQPWQETGSQLLVVDNASTDDTPQVLERYREKLPLRWVREMTPGHSSARNRALAEAGSSSHLLFTDDDVIVGEGWLAAFVEAQDRYPDGAVFGGPVDPWFAHDPDPELLEAFPALRSGFCGIDHPGADGPIDSGRVFGANMGFRLSALGGMRFDTRLGHKHGRFMAHEELAVIASLRAAGGTVVWVPGMRLQHYVDPSRMTVDYLARHYQDFARGKVRTTGVPSGPRIAGVPRWVIRQLVLRRLAYLAYSAVGNRPRALSALRDASLSLGTVKESYAVAHEDALPDGSR
jgi:glycosyltransferase involved in cell wall biosynthesis